MSDNNQQPSVARFKLTLNGSLFSVVRYGIVLFLRENVWARTSAAIIATGLLVLATVIFMGITPGTSMAAIFLVFGAAELIWFVTVAGREFEVSFESQDATRERQKAEQQLKDSNDPNDVLTLDFKRLNEYYIINQNQAKSSFRWAVFAMLFGFTTIIAGIWLFYFKRDVPDTFMASLSTAAGLVVNFVSGLFLYLHHKTQERSLHYYRQLSRIQNIALAMRLADAQPNEEAKIKSRAKVIDQLLKSSVSSEVRQPGPQPLSESAQQAQLDSD